MAGDAMQDSLFPELAPPDDGGASPAGRVVRVDAYERRPPTRRRVTRGRTGGAEPEGPVVRARTAAAALPTVAPGSATSARAAQRITRTAPTKRAVVLLALRAVYPAGYTRDELAGVTGLKKDTVNGRVVELRALGRIREEGERHGCGVLYAIPAEVMDDASGI